MVVPQVDGPAVAFCGIARPGQFFEGLERAGLRLAAKIAFRDHHRYTAADLSRLQAVANAAGAVALVTTEKDRVRMGKLVEALSPHMPLKTAQLRIQIDGEAGAVDRLGERLKCGS
jgi:tetraacyldisaccharide 4'-kinase